MRKLWGFNITKSGISPQALFIEFTYPLEAPIQGKFFKATSTIYFYKLHNLFVH